LLRVLLSVHEHNDDSNALLPGKIHGFCEGYTLETFYGF